MAGFNEIAREAGVNPIYCRRCGEQFTSSKELQKLFDIILERILNGERVKIVGFGTFYPVDVPPRTVKSPLMPDGIMEYPGRRTIRFRVSGKLKKYFEEQKASKKAKNRRKKAK